MAEGWSGYSAGRHHGAHRAEAVRSLGVKDENLLDFSANINPLGPPSSALQAGKNALLTQAQHYPDLRYTDLKEALAQYLGVSSDLVLPTNGGAEALFLAARSASEGKALILEPAFSEYAAAAQAAGLEPVRRVAWRLNGERFVLDHTAFEDLEGVKLVFLTNPNNPTGSVLQRVELLDLLELVRGAGAVLVLDEAFADFLPGISAVSEVGDGLIIARSFTKFFALPGLRLGCLVTPDAVRFQSLQPSWPVNVVAAAAVEAAVRDRAFIQRSLEEVRKLKAELFEALGMLPGVTPYPGAANFLLVKGPAGIPERLARQGMLVRGCAPFMGLGPEYFRVAVLGREENEALVRALREGL